MTETASRWCPSCGDEYRSDIEICADCVVPLVDEEPETLTPVTRSDVEAVTESFVVDLGSLTEEQRAVLAEHVDSVPIPLRIVGEGLIQAEDGYDDELELALARVLTGEARRKLRYAVSLVDEPLSLGRRVLATVIDGAIVGAVTGLVDQLLDGGVVSVIAIAISLLNQIVGLHERGRSFGKFLVGGAVRTPGGEELSWEAATVRWLVKDGPSTVPVILWWSFQGGRSVWVLGQLIVFCYFCGLVGSVLFDQQRRGLHDLIPDTVVVRPD